MSMVWNPFKRRRRSVAQDAQTVNEKTATTSARAAVSPPTAPTPPVPRRSSRRSKRRMSAQQEKTTEARSVSAKKRQGPPEKESMLRARRGSIEDITALPVSRRLNTSPHLRPADLERPHIPYNFRPYSSSQTSIQRTEAKPSRPQTLRSKRSGTPSRRRSGRRRNNDTLREEEIRAMSQPMQIPKRPGEGPLRRDSKKLRGLGVRGSNVSLPAAESVHSSMSGVIEQRGWEVGLLDVFNPRPAVRLSGTPQYVASASAPNTSYLPPATPKKDKEKRPMTRETMRKRDTIGEQANDLDASDLRMLMDRDKKRRERRDKERQEKLDRKLRNRNGRNRGDSDKQWREVEEKRREEEVKRNADEQERARTVAPPPTDVHPALRDEPVLSEAAGVGLGIGASQAVASIESAKGDERVLPTTEDLDTNTASTQLQHGTRDGSPANPFADPAPPPTPPAVEPQLERLPSLPGAFSPIESPTEDSMPPAMRAVRMSQTETPPQSPVGMEYSTRVPSSLSQVRTSDLPGSPPFAVDERRSSEPKDRRAGAWASFFRRGGTNLRKPGDERSSTPSETSFSNMSRESMRNQPLPAHLIDTQVAPGPRRKSGTPVRTQSKFREDLPEMPVSPPDSRMPSPDVAQMAALAAAARRGKKVPRPVDIPGARSETPDPASINRHDTPVSPGTRGHGLMSASLASVDSEGSWLASSGKRQSAQSTLSRSIGSLSKRRPEFTGSYEELGGDKDAEYFQQRISTGAGARGVRRISSAALAGASPDEESEYGEAADAPPPADPFTVHESVRRKPTLVHRDPRVKSREGLLGEFQAAEVEDSPISKDDFDLPETPEAEEQVQDAKSIDYGRGHARQMSAGSARLLDIPASKRQSVEGGLGSPTSPSIPASRTSQL